MPITPIGTRAFTISSPLGRSQRLILEPTGSFRAATWRRPEIIPLRRAGVSRSRSSMAGASPDSLPASMSLALASVISVLRASSSSAMETSIAFFLRALQSTSSREAASACSPTRTISSCRLMLFPPESVSRGHQTAARTSVPVSSPAMMLESTPVLRPLAITTLQPALAAAAAAFNLVAIPPLERCES